ncbi:MAG: transcriptional regulator [Flavobacteriales bacterium]|nr:transcriptional regulator [Flavobacteriales bacterium]|tara:strand:+ start:43 stop:498 length:456 start_codon:yes stop_codon:yes gene_type:complete
MFSKACEYAIRATLFIAKSSISKKRVRLGEIAEAIDSPEAFTAKILQQLAKNNVVKSIKGPYGGFEISRQKMNKMPLRKIVEAIDGDDIFVGCAMGLSACDAERPCPLHYHFVHIRDELSALLNNTTVYQMAHSLDEGLTFLKRLDKTAKA